MIPCATAPDSLPRSTNGGTTPFRSFFSDALRRRRNTPVGVATALVDLPGDGYIIVLQDIRGRFKSKAGCDAVTRDRTDPGDHAHRHLRQHQWLLKNVPGNNGRVGMVGTSYPAWLAVMALDPYPALKAIVPMVSFADMWLGTTFITMARSPELRPRARLRWSLPRRWSAPPR
jgi:predicted acyl esterase